MSWPDAINGIFEAGGAWWLWQDVKALRAHKAIKGVYWPARCYFAAWGVWNLAYYPSLDQWASFAGGAAIVLVNVYWCYLALWFTTAVERQQTSLARWLCRRARSALDRLGVQVLDLLSRPNL